MALNANTSATKKRKNPPTANSSANSINAVPNKKLKANEGARRRDARLICAQASSKAFQNGALDVDKFIKAREFEILALEDGIQRSKHSLNTRAFQQLPRDLRRRTASHDAKRVPKRIRKRAKQEMVRDATPLVTARTRKPSSHKRLRLETAKKLRVLSLKRKSNCTKSSSHLTKGADANSTRAKNGTVGKNAVKPRPPRLKNGTLQTPTIPKAKFRKRQINKAWLPTHMFHAKRAHMTPPSAPLWGFAIPLAPTQKSYRSTHRTSSDCGAIAWDTSYMSTIALDGQRKSIEGMLRALGVTMEDQSDVFLRWKNGTRVLETFLYQREAPCNLIAPVQLLWCVPMHNGEARPGTDSQQTQKLFIRVHPSAFFQLWEEVKRLSKVAKPYVSIHDLRYDVGSIEITGPGSTEALLAALLPFNNVATEEGAKCHERTRFANLKPVEKTWISLAGLTTPSTLPLGAMLGFDIQDPRLRQPPRTISLPQNEEAFGNLLHLISLWPVDHEQTAASLFNSLSRFIGSKLISQKAVNRRKARAKAGEYPSLISTDVPIPVILFVSKNTTCKRLATWTVLAPWKCIPPIWNSIMYYPLSTGQQPKLGGMAQQRQLTFEAGQPWFPADFPGCDAGWKWEIEERQRRKSEWARRPAGKRVAWEKVDLGGGRKGEVGDGSACSWELLLPTDHETQTSRSKDVPKEDRHPSVDRPSDGRNSSTENGTIKSLQTSRPEMLSQVHSVHACALLTSRTAPKPPGCGLIVVHLNLLTRGLPQVCARIYRLPAEQTSRKQWLGLQPNKHGPSSKRKSTELPRVPKDAPPHIIQQRLAQSLLEAPRAGDDGYPSCPGVEDLMGFVTSANFSLAEGKGVGIGCLALARAMESVRTTKMRRDGWLCIVRNSGESVGRLALWQVVA